MRVEAVDGAAARAGLREGDVILSIDNTEITDVKQFNQLAQKAEKAKAVSVLVRRGEAGQLPGDQACALSDELRATIGRAAMRGVSAMRERQDPCQTGSIVRCRPLG